MVSSDRFILSFLPKTFFKLVGLIPVPGLLEIRSMCLNLCPFKKSPDVTKLLLAFFLDLISDFIKSFYTFLKLDKFYQSFL